MIEEIFIVSNNQVLVGDISKFPKYLEYPTSIYENKQVTQLKCNNINLAILYSNIDTFTILEYLKNLKHYLEENICELTTNNVLSNYFLIREIISEKFVKNYPKKYKIPALSTNEIFIDVIETYNAVLCKDYSSCEIIGYCFVKPRFNEQNVLKLVIRNDAKLNYLSNYKVTERFSKLEIELNLANEDVQILKFKTRATLPFKIECTKQGLNLVTEDLKFDLLEINIPCTFESNQTTFSASKGTIVKSDENDKIKWIFKNEKIGMASLKLQTNYLECQSDSNLDINFKICKTPKHILDIEKAICIDDHSVDVWIRYDAYGSKIEVRGEN